MVFGWAVGRLFIISVPPLLLYKCFALSGERDSTSSPLGLLRLTPDTHTQAGTHTHTQKKPVTLRLQHLHRAPFSQSRLKVFQLFARTCRRTNTHSHRDAAKCTFPNVAPLPDCSVSCLSPHDPLPALPPTGSVHLPKAGWHGDADGTAVARR